jgi:pimeloyl-ACP methyl ester carboxylesterase
VTQSPHFADTPYLSIAYEVSGPEQGPPVVLLHGWPDDARTWDRCVPILNAAGLKTFVPFLRGFGPTRFLKPDTFRSGQLSALGRDLIDFADALKLGSFALVGHDWGARAAYIASVLAPGRITRSVAVSVGWGTNHPQQTLSLQQVQNYWYHWYMALDRGAELVRSNRKAFTRHIWDIWNPRWKISDQEFEATAVSFDNPDWADIVLHSYRVRWGHALGDPTYAATEARLAGPPKISVPTLMIHGGGDPCTDPRSSAGKEGFFTGRYERIVLDGVGHFPQREAPREVAQAITRFLRS